MNHTELTACIAEMATLRYTPAGLPALDLVLEHEGQVNEAGQVRQVRLQIRSISLETQAERLSRQVIGSRWRFQGFLATPARGKSVVFHIQDFHQD